VDEGITAWDPLGETNPIPDTLTLVAFAVCHESVAVSPCVIVVGLALSVAVGAASAAGALTAAPGCTPHPQHPASAQATRSAGQWPPRNRMVSR